MCSFCIVLRHSASLLVHEPQIQPRLRRSCFCPSPIPLHRLGIVFGKSLSVVVQQPKRKQRMGIVVLRRLPQVLDSFIHVATVVDQEPPKLILTSGEALFGRPPIPLLRRVEGPA